MKALSLMADTVILIIIAAVVLAIVLVFFKSSTSSGFGQVNLEQERVQLCRQYVIADARCDSLSQARSANGEVVTKVLEMCKQIGGYTACSDSANEQECIRDCCEIFCGGTTTTQKPIPAATP
ncbi:MAG: hypothetical protein J4473_06035 [Candidatus Aenigmarchaeota archaeon]|nr:hypothetical protein [Candidatus Aenigmarchaeota archaeon]